MYTTDIGLCTYMYGFETQKTLLLRTLKGHAKGGIFENLIFDMLNKRVFALYYFKKQDNTEEIEFIYEKDGAVIPIEVKRGPTDSLKSFIKEFKPPYAYKLIDGILGIMEEKIPLPQYMAAFL